MSKKQIKTGVRCGLFVRDKCFNHYSKRVSARERERERRWWLWLRCSNTRKTNPTGNLAIRCHASIILCALHLYFDPSHNNEVKLAGGFRQRESKICLPSIELRRRDVAFDFLGANYQQQCSERLMFASGATHPFHMHACNSCVLSPSA